MIRKHSTIEHSISGVPSVGKNAIRHLSLTVVFFHAVFFSAVSIGDNANIPVAFQIKPIAITGNNFPKLLKLPCDKLALLAYRGGAFSPVPFQIDIVDRNGKYILAETSAKISAWPNGNIFSEKDELVFMASDSGEKATGFGGDFGTTYEIKIENQASKTTKYVYLVENKNTKFQRSDADYVKYRKSSQSEEIVTSNYTQGFAKDGVFYRDLIINPQAGGAGIDIMDKLKLRARVTAVSGKLSISRKESDFSSRVIGLRDGPVRIIRRNLTKMSLFKEIKSPSVIVDGIFYKSSFEVPSEMKIPFRIDLAISSIDYMQGCDLALEAGPFTFYSNNDPRGVAVDGAMSDAENKLERNRDDHWWGLITGKSGTLMYEAIYDEKLPVKIKLFYKDDKNLSDPPEYNRGLHIFGLKIVNLLDLRGETYNLNVVNYIIPDFNGNVEATVKSLRSQFAVGIAQVK